MNKIKLIGLAAIAVMALTATQASANPEPREFRCVRSATANCIVSGQSNDVIPGFQGVENKCTEHSGVPGFQVQAVMPETTPSLSLATSFAGCTQWGVKMEGCSFTISLVPGSFSPFPAPLDIVCPAGKSIAMHLPGMACNITIGAQSGLSGVTLKEHFESGSWTTEVATIGLTNIAYSASGGECSNPGSRSDGKLTGTVELKAFENVGGSPGKQRSLQIL